MVLKRQLKPVIIRAQQIAFVTKRRLGMTIRYDDFIHPSDKKALDALKAIPSFDLVLKKFLSIVGEKMFQIQTTSSYLKLGPDQMPEIYNLLVKVCGKLEIDVPELYLALNREPNAYTTGDTDVFIVINSGLLETMTLEQVETVIAHECGHIVCHHVLYHTMGRYILSGADFFANGIVSRAIITSLQYAFAYWMRCSEFSADRVAAFYHGTADPVIDLMMALAGGTHNLSYKLSRDAFFKQAQNYKILVDNSTYNKIIEFIQYGEINHPLNAYRAYEISEFYKKQTKKMSPSNDDCHENELNLRVRYEFIKSKSILKIGNALRANQLEIKIGKKKYYIGKNDTKDISMKGGEYKLSITNTIKRKSHTVDLRYNMSIVVTWDSDTQKLSVREEM